MKSYFCYALVLIILTLTSSLLAQMRVRDEVQIPDIEGYLTLACDFHTHTVFSDGNVWPTVRPEEAWRNGLDAIAITDHIEYLPHKDDVRVDHNRSHELAEPHGHALGLIVIRGSEITRKMPPGHLNAIFLEDASQLDTEHWRDAIKTAHDQGAFIFWNHPGWRGQQPDGIARWYEEHSELVDKGMMHGMEVVNAREYYPEVHQWCLDKNLTMLSNSDIHQPIYMDYNFANDDKSPITLVFATKRTESAIKEALFNRRTAVYANNQLIGREEFLHQIFERSIRIKNPVLDFTEKRRNLIRIANKSEVNFQILITDSPDQFSLPEELTLYAHKVNLISLRKSEIMTSSGTIKINLTLEVKNLLVSPGTGLTYQLPVEVQL